MGRYKKLSSAGARTNVAQLTLDITAMGRCYYSKSPPTYSTRKQTQRNAKPTYLTFDVILAPENVPFSLT